MAQDQLSYSGGVERRRHPRIVANQSSLVWGFALLEGALASLVMMICALVYHMVIQRVTPSQTALELYAVYSTAVGLLYGGFSAVAAVKFLHHTQDPHTPLSDAVLGWTGAFAIALFGAFLAGLADELSRITLILAYVVGLPALLIVRTAIYSGVALRVRTGRLQYQKVSVIGSRADVVRFLLNGNLWKAGYQLASTLYLDDVSNPDGSLGERPIIDFAKAGVARGAEYIVFVGEIGDIDGLQRVTNQLKRFAINVVCAPATQNTSFKFLDVVPLGANNAVRFLRKPMSDMSVLLKRLFDLCCAGFGLLILSPLFAVVALLIKLDSPGPVFYRQERRGFNGQSFFIWKFRSMSVTESGQRMTQVRAGDKRITRIGAFIRRTSIDELPQLFNVIGGEMSLVGPRPHAVMHDDEFGHQFADYAHRQRIKPGITGWAQVNGYRGETSTIEAIEGRTAHDLYYIDNWSIFLDCWIIILTVFSAKTRKNAV